MAKQHIYRINYIEFDGLDRKRRYFDSDFSGEYGAFSKFVPSGWAFKKCKFGDKALQGVRRVNFQECTFGDNNLYSAERVNLLDCLFYGGELNSSKMVTLKGCSLKDKGYQNRPQFGNSCRGVFIEFCDFSSPDIVAFEDSESIFARDCKFNGFWALKNAKHLDIEDCDFTGERPLGYIKDATFTGGSFSGEDSFCAASNVIIKYAKSIGDRAFWNSGDIFVYAPNAVVKGLFPPVRGIIVVEGIENIRYDGGSLNYKNPHIYVLSEPKPTDVARHVKKINGDILMRLQEIVLRGSDLKWSLEDAVRQGILPSRTKKN